MSKFMNRPPPAISSASSNSSTFVEKIMIGLDHAPAAFDLRGQLIGAGGANLNYIRNETGAIATLRGRGSLFIDPTLGMESPEPMHLYVEHARFDGLQNAKQLAKNLIETLQQELIHFQQITPLVQYAQQATSAIPSTHTQAISAPLPQMSVPPPMLAVRPPYIQPNIDIGVSSLQQSNIITQNASAIDSSQQPPQIQATEQQPTILQQQTIIPQTVPIHLHQGNMVIQQEMQPNNMNIPVKQGSLIHFQSPPPALPLHISQPPPKIQLQSPATQIVLNQPQANYHIQQPEQNLVTIQYQPHSIVQQSAQPVLQQAIRPTQSQQYILQGNTFSCITTVPPPNIIQQQPPVQLQQHSNIIFHTASHHQNHSQLPLQHFQLHPPPNFSDVPSVTNGNDDNGSLNKDEKATPEPNENSLKQEEKSDTESHEINSQQAATHQPSIPLQIPPPFSCVQHIVGSTLITTSPTATQTHQIYNPVSIQQIQAAPLQQQQIHVSTQSGQHFLVNAQQWQPQQQFQQSSEIRNNMQSQQHTMTTEFNPQIPAPSATGIQVQLQHVPQAQILQTIENHQQLIEQQQIQQEPSQNLNSALHPSYNTIQSTLQLIESHAKVNGLPYQQPHDQPRLATKRKRDADDDQNSPRLVMPPRMGTGAGHQILNNQRDVHPFISSNATTSSLSVMSSSAAGVMTTTNIQDESITREQSAGIYFNKPMVEHQQIASQHQSSIPAQNSFGTRSFYRMHFEGPPASTTTNTMPTQQSMGGISMVGGSRGSSRFYANNNNNNNSRNDFSHPMRLTDANIPIHRMNFGPPPPPPPPPLPSAMYPRMQQSRFRAQW